MNNIIKSNEPIKRHRYILGSGLVGLITGHYNPRYKIIGTKIGGQFKSSFSLGPRYFHDTPEIRSLLDSLKISYLIREIRVGYFYQGRIVHDIDLEAKKLYFRKSRLAYSMKDEHLNIKHSMTSGIKKFNVLEFDMGQFIKKMPPVIEDTITHINTFKRYLIGKKEIYYYSHLVSTIPAPTFDNLRNHVVYYDYCPITYFLVKSNTVDLEGNDYVYYVDVDDEIPWHRITKVGEKLYVVEVAGFADVISDNRRQVSKVRKLGEILNHSFQLYGEVIGRGPRYSIPRIIKIGRYANWDHSKRIHEVVKDVQDLAKTAKNQQGFKRSQFKKKTKGYKANDTKPYDRSHRASGRNKLGTSQTEKEDNKK